MKVALICFSLTGQQTGERLCRGLEAAGMTAELDKKSKYLLDSIQISTSAWAGEKFSDSDALIFIGATGIAVRSIAPYVASKISSRYAGGDYGDRSSQPFCSRCFCKEKQLQYF